MTASPHADDPGATPANATEAPAAPALEWTVNPWKADPRRATLALVIGVLSGALVVSLGLASLTGVVLWVALLLSLSPAFWVLRCRVDEHGVSRRLLFAWERRPWDRIGRAKLTRLGLWIAPPATPGWLEPFRGLWLPVRGASDAHADLVSDLRHRLVQHGL
jgi:hypothetical protein